MLAPAISSGTTALDATSKWGCGLCVSHSTPPENSRDFPLRASGRHNRLQSAFRRRPASVLAPLSGCCSFGFASTRFRTKRGRRAFPIGKAMLCVSDSRDGLMPRTRCLRRSRMNGRQLLHLDLGTAGKWQRLKGKARRFTISPGTMSFCCLGEPRFARAGPSHVTDCCG